MARTETIVLGPRSVATYDRHAVRKIRKDISAKRYRAWWVSLARTNLVELPGFRTFPLSTPGTIAYQRRT